VTPAHPDDRDVVEQEAVDLHDGDFTGGESDHQDASLDVQAAQGIGETVASDGVDHDVDLALGQHGVLEAVGQDVGVGTGLDGHGTLRIGGGHRDDLAGTPRLGDLNGRRPDSAGGAVNQHTVAGLDPAAFDETEVGGA